MRSVFLWFIFAFSLHTSTLTDFINACPRLAPCICSAPTIQCKCNRLQKNLTLSVLKVFLNPSFPTNDFKRVEVSGCNFVQVNTGAFRNIKPSKIEFKDIQKLYIRPFSLSGVDTITNLTLSNIALLDIDLFGLSGLYGVSDIKILNVTGHNLAEFAISGGDINQVLIKNSVLPLESFSYIMWNVTTFTIIDTHFLSLKNSSILLRNIDEFSIYNSHFTSPSPESLAFLWMEFVHMINNTFDVLPEKFITCSTEHFNFLDNVVEYAESDAFLLVFVSDSAEFRNNKFSKLEEDSLFPNPNNNLSATIESLVVKGNEIFCDCRLAWMFNNTKAYSALIQSSTCLNHKNTRLTEMMRFFAPSNQCQFEGFSPEQKGGKAYIDEVPIERLSSKSFKLKFSFAKINTLVIVGYLLSKLFNKTLYM